MELETLLAQLVTGIERGEDFDEDAFLSEHPEVASELRSRLDKLRSLGLIGSGRKLGGVLSRVGARFGVHITEPSHTLVPRKTVGGRYEVRGLLGRGGMGTVYRAFDTHLQRQVALKITNHPSSEGRYAAPQAGVERFVFEAQVTGQLEHPGVVSVHELGTTDDGRFYLAMKLVEGRTLAEILHDLREGDPDTCRDFDLARLLQIVERLCETLAFAHSRGFVHRDLKPDNVMVGAFGEVQLMDWGLAKLVGESEPDGPEVVPSPTSTPGSTMPGQRLGTPSYMAPEQAEGASGEIDERTDVFGVGALLFRILAGEPPYCGSDVEEVVRRAKERELDERRLAEVSTPSELRGVCSKALSKDKRDRYGSVDELREDLIAYREQRPGRGWKETPRSSLIKLVRRRPVAFAVASGLSVVVVLSLALLSVAQSLQHQREQARIEKEEKDRLDREVRDRAFLREASSPDVGAERQVLELHLPSALDRELGLAKAWGVDFELSDTDTILDAIHAAEVRDPALRQAAKGLVVRLYWALDLVWVFRDYLTTGSSDIEPEPLATSLCPKVQDLLLALEEDELVAQGWTIYWDWIAGGRRGHPAFDELGAFDTIPEKEWLAFVSGRVGDYERKLKLLRELVEWEPSNVAAHRELVTIYWSRNEHEAALRHAEIYRSIAPESAWAWSFVGSSWMALREDEHAIDNFERALEIEPDLRDARLNLAVSALRLGNLELARANLDRLLEHFPDYPKAHANYGHLERDSGNRSAAIASFSRAIDLDPSYAAATFSLAKLLWEEGEIDEARRSFVRSFELEPREASWRSTYAQFLDDAGGHEEAVVQFRKAIELDSTRAAYQSGLGDALLATGDVNGAMEAWMGAIVLGEQDERVHASVAEYVSMIDDPSRVARDLQKLASEGPCDSLSALSLGIALLRSGDASSAVAYLLLARVLAPEHPRVPGWLGLALLDVGEPKRGLEHLQAAFDATMKDLVGERKEPPEIHARELRALLKQGSDAPEAGPLLQDMEGLLESIEAGDFDD